MKFKVQKKLSNNKPLLLHVKSQLLFINRIQENISSVSLTFIFTIFITYYDAHIFLFHFL